MVVLVFNAALTAAFFLYQGQRIAKEEYLIASFRKMESIYRVLKADAGQDRRIRIDAKTYLAGKDEEAARGIIALKDFVDIEEKFAGPVDRKLSEKVYEVRSDKKIEAQHGKIVYKDNGIVLFYRI